MDEEAFVVKLLEGVRKVASVSHVLLTGPPGAGKTTLSGTMAEERNLPVIHVDMLPKMEGSRFAGTDSLRRKMNRLRKPYLIEGAQALGLQPEELKPHEVIVLNPRRRVLVDRLIKRGWTDSYGKQWKGEMSRAKANELVDRFQKIVRDFNRSRRTAE